MFKFIRGRGHGHVSQEKIKELFAFQATVPHGYPHHPTSLAYDSDLSLMAVTSKRGVLRVYGRPGVEYSADLLDVESDVRQIRFLPGKRGQLVLLTEDGLIQLWEINTESQSLQKVKSWNDFVRGEGSIRHATTIEVLVTNASSGKEAVSSGHQELLVGTESGSVFVIDLQSFEQTTDSIIHQDSILQSIPSEYKKSSQGSVEVVCQRPGNRYRDQPEILVGFTRGLIVVWNVKNRKTTHFFNSSQQLESLSWMNRGDQFISSHNDGSYIVWKVNQTGDQLHPQAPLLDSKIPYGPFPCKPIGRIVCKTVKNGENLLFFAGGMPRASYGDKFTVSVIQGDQDSGKHHVLDFTSKVIDFVVIDEPDLQGHDNPVALIVLLEEEIVVIDLKHPEWLQFKLPYMSSVHSSGITSCQHYSDVPDEVFDSIISAGKKQDQGKFSTSSWPIRGGDLPEEKTASDKTPSDEATSSPSSQVKEVSSSNRQVKRTKDLLITGHEDGSIVFWNASDVNLYHILSIQTRKFFLATDSDISPIDGEEGGNEEESNEWPPFRRVGSFDPYSDDVRLAVRRIAFCPMTGVFFVAGTAGQVVSFQVSQETKEVTLELFSSNIVEETTGFAWKGHDPLEIKRGAIKVQPGFHPQYVLQLHPPAAVTALTVNSEWSLISAGTAHGFAVFDYIQKKVVFSKSTLNMSDLAATSGGDGALITRRKSFKKSLRESFRRLRRGRSGRGKKSSSPAKDGEGAGTSTAASSAATSPVKKLVSPVRSLASAEIDDDARPVERQIEARTDDGLGSMIRTLYFTTATIVSGSSPVPSLWVGTNSGTIFIHTLTIPSEDKRTGTAVAAVTEETPVSTEGEAAIDAPAVAPPAAPSVPDAVTVTLAKEIQLKHRAPVIFIQVVDSTGYPLPGAFEVEKGRAKAPSTVGSQKVLIVSEEQFKLFTLPNLRPDRKSKLTAHEGSRARRIAIGHFVSKSDEKVVEHSLICASNQGEVSIYTISDLKRVKNEAVIKREDVHGISSIVLASSGEGLYLHSPSEFMRFTLSARKVVVPLGFVSIPEGVRPKKPEPPVEVPAPVAVPVEAEVLQKKPSVILEEDEAVVIEEETGNNIADASVISGRPSDHSTPIPPPEEVSIPRETTPTLVCNSEVIETTITNDIISTPIIQEVPTASLPDPLVLETEIHSDPAVIEAVIQAPIHEESTVTNGRYSFNGLVEVNGASSNANGNGHHEDEEEEEEDDEGASLPSPPHAANGADEGSSLLTDDITIDSVRDFTNLNLGDGSADKPKKVVTPTPDSSTTEAVSSSGGKQQNQQPQNRNRNRNRKRNSNRK